MRNTNERTTVSLFFSPYCPFNSVPPTQFQFVTFLSNHALLSQAYESHFLIQLPHHHSDLQSHHQTTFDSPLPTLATRSPLLIGGIGPHFGNTQVVAVDWTIYWGDWEESV